MLRVLRCARPRVTHLHWHWRRQLNAHTHTTTTPQPPTQQYNQRIAHRLSRAKLKDENLQKDVESIWNEMQQAQVKPDYTTLKMMLVLYSRLSKEPNLEKMHHFYDLIKKEGHSISSDIINLFVKAYASVDTKQMLQFWELSKKLGPNRKKYMYNTVLRALARDGG